MLEKENRWWDPIAGGALILIVFLAAYSLELTKWTNDLSRITIIAVLGAISGILIGQSVYRRKIAIILILIYTFLIYIWQFIFSLSTEQMWVDRLTVLIGRFQSTIGQIKHNVPLDDGILFLALMSFIFCLVSISAGYSFARNGTPWISLGIVICIFYIIQFILTPFLRNSSLIILFTILVVLFIGRTYYLQQNKKWTASGYQEDKEASRFLTKTILIIAMVFTSFSWGIPYLSSKILRPEDNEVFISRRNYSEAWERTRNFFYPLKPQGVFGNGIFSETLSLGLSRNLDDEIVFNVQIPGDSSHFGRYYWKARVYSLFERGLWRNESLELKT